VNLQYLNTGSKDSTPVSLLDFDTKEPIREPFLNRDLAMNTLALNKWNYGLHLNNSLGFDCNIVGQKVILKEAYKPLDACTLRYPKSHYFALKNRNRKQAAGPI
jgi:hypothetical protein